jgi:hypothetical protein
MDQQAKSANQAKIDVKQAKIDSRVEHAAERHARYEELKAARQARLCEKHAAFALPDMRGEVAKLMRRPEVIEYFERRGFPLVEVPDPRG